MRKLKDDEWFGSGDTKSAIETCQQNIGKLYRELMLCIRAKSCGWQLLCVFPGEEKGKAHRRQVIVPMALQVEGGRIAAIKTR